MVQSMFDVTMRSALTVSFARFRAPMHLCSLAASIFIGLSSVSRAEEMEPTQDMSSQPSVIFYSDVGQIKDQIVRTLSQLQGVDLASGAPRFETREWQPDFPKDSWMAKNCASLQFTIYEVSWIPPKPAPQLVSNGGRNIKPVRSKIMIVCGSLIANRKAVVVRLSREWTYDALLHIPYTEIPLWRSEQSKQGSYSSDRSWLHNLMPDKDRGSFAVEVEYDDKVLGALANIPKD